MNDRAEGGQPRPAIGYARVSTIEQCSEGVSLGMQTERIKAYATAKGLELGEVLVDEGCSGKDLKRPALQDLLARCERGEVGHVIVWKLDRLTRRTRHLLNLVEDTFLAKHIELHSVSESLDTGTPHGRFVLTLFGGLAQMERELIGERTRSAMAFKRENGQPTSHPPLGFRVNGSRKHRMLPVPEELAIVHRILTAWRAGGSYAGIARELNQEGVASKRGGRWHAATVRKVVAPSGLVRGRSEGLLGAHLIRGNGRISKVPFEASPATRTNEGMESSNPPLNHFTDLPRFANMPREARSKNVLKNATSWALDFLRLLLRPSLRVFGR